MSTECLRLPFTALLACAHLVLGGASWSGEGGADGKDLEQALKRLTSQEFDEREGAKKAVLDALERQYLKVAEGLTSSDPEVQHRTEEILSEYPQRLRAAEILGRTKPEDREKVKAWLNGNPALLKQLASTDPEERAAACTPVGELDAAVALPVLLALARDKSESAQRAAVKALGKLGSVEALPFLMAATGLSSKPAGKALGAGRFVAAQISINGISEDLRPICQVAIEAIGGIRHPDAAAFLAKKLADPAGGTVADYIRALAATRQTALALPPLMELLDDSRVVATLEMQFRTAQMGGLATLPGMGKATVGEVACAAVVELSGQSDDEYGLAFPRKERGWPGAAPVKVFPDEKTRQESVAKLRKWFEEWKKKAQP